jgi:hypothetical protein
MEIAKTKKSGKGMPSEEMPENLSERAKGLNFPNFGNKAKN